MAETKRLIKMEEVKLHNKPNDLWMVIEGKVYDLTKFRNEHPGGEDTLDEQGGLDATQPFLDVGHSDEARQMMEQYWIGNLDESDLPGNLPVRQIGCAVGAFALGLLAVFLLRRVMAK